MCDHLDRDRVFVAVQPASSWRSSVTSTVGLVRSSRVDGIADTAAASAMCRLAESVVVSCLDTEFARGRLFAPGRRPIEVKGTVVPGRAPRLSAGELAQMSAAWVDRVDNPAMAEVGLANSDVYGGVAIVNFVDLTWKATLTGDFLAFEPSLPRDNGQASPG